VQRPAPAWGSAFVVFRGAAPKTPGYLQDKDKWIADKCQGAVDSMPRRGYFEGETQFRKHAP